MAECDSASLIQYSPLKADELRLVALQPGEDDDIIECKIEHLTFEASREERQYKALSYMWGSPNEARSISIDSRTCYIRQNLWWALYFLRSKEEVIVLWIDALCINQANIEERNYQVRQMDRIYKDAKKVVIWVGCESPNDAKALPYIWEIYDKGDIPTRFYSPHSCINWGISNIGWYKQHLHRWEEISKFCARPYWTRQWIIQEVMLATNASVQCGEHSMDWRFFRDVTYPVPLIEDDEEQRDIRQQIGSSGLRKVIIGKAKAGSQQGSSPLLDLVVAHRDAKCLERRDKVFGVHSMSQLCCKEAVPVDYSKPEYLLFVETIEHHFYKHDQSNRLLNSRRALQLFFKDQSDSDVETTTELIIKALPYNTKFFKFPGQINDLVSYCTPSLNSIPPRYEKIILDEEGDWSPSSALAREINKWYESQQAGGDQLETALSDFENVQTLDWRVSFRYPEGQMEGLKSGSMPLRDRADEKDAPEKGTSHVREIVVQMIRDAERVAKSSSLNADCKLFFTRNGRIGFGPSTMKSGDLLSHLNGSGMDVIIRLSSDEEKLVTVGNAVPYFARGIPEQEDTALGRPEVSFHLDFTTFVLISLPENAARIARKLFSGGEGQGVPFFWGSDRWIWRGPYSGWNELMKL
ncbi:hypothetical protein EG329_000812 [Mollisiaceae sp. DMI_Dod_QoI]|nr:hypothetical protein EG329_000812 [Helotiales sp. DMI_Dod_QoI]